MERVFGDIWTILVSFLTTQETIRVSVVTRWQRDKFARGVWPRLQRFDCDLSCRLLWQCDFKVLSSTLRQQIALKRLRLIASVAPGRGMRKLIPFGAFTGLLSVELHPLLAPLSDIFLGLASCHKLQSLSLDGTARKSSPCSDLCQVSKHIKIGDHAYVTWSNNAEWYKGEVTAHDTSNDTYTVHFCDGDMATNLRPESIMVYKPVELIHRPRIYSGNQGSVVGKEEPRFLPGQDVSIAVGIHGLAAMPQSYNTWGTVVRWHSESDEYEIAVPHPQQSILVHSKYVAPAQRAKDVFTDWSEVYAPTKKPLTKLPPTLQTLCLRTMLTSVETLNAIFTACPNVTALTCCRILRPVSFKTLSISLECMQLELASHLRTLVVDDLSCLLDDVNRVAMIPWSFLEMLCVDLTRCWSLPDQDQYMLALKHMRDLQLVPQLRLLRFICPPDDDRQRCVALASPERRAAFFKYADHLLNGLDAPGDKLRIECQIKGASPLQTPHWA